MELCERFTQLRMEPLTLESVSSWLPSCPCTCNASTHLVLGEGRARLVVARNVGALRAAGRAACGAKIRWESSQLPMDMVQLRPQLPW